MSITYFNQKIMKCKGKLDGLYYKAFSSSCLMLIYLKAQNIPSRNKNRFKIQLGKLIEWCK